MSTLYIAGLRVFGRALTTTPVLGFSPPPPPPRLSLSLIALPCSPAAARRLILSLANADLIGSGPSVGSFLSLGSGGFHPGQTEVRASVAVRQEARIT